MEQHFCQPRLADLRALDVNHSGLRSRSVRVLQFATDYLLQLICLKVVTKLHSKLLFLFSAGQWARALCINNTLEMGSILPYLKKCKELGFGVIVCNPNLNYDFVTPPTISRTSFLTTSKTTAKLPERVKIKCTFAQLIRLIPIC